MSQGAESHRVLAQNLNFSEPEQGTHVVAGRLQKGWKVIFNLAKEYSAHKRTFNLRDLPWPADSALERVSVSRALFSGTICGMLLFVLLTTVFTGSTSSADAVDLPSEEVFLLVDPDLILEPDPEKFQGGPLVQRALFKAHDPKVRVQLEHRVQARSA